MKAYRYYDLILGAYVCVVLCANLIGAAKVATVQVPFWGPVTFMAGVLFFPISYFFGDILTEVYGYARDRRVVWSGFAALGFATLMSVVIVRLPPADFWRPEQPAVEAIFGDTPRIALGSMVAFWCGSFVNSYVLAKMKLMTSGRWLWTRTIGSTLCASDLITVTMTQYVLKSGWEVVATPATYWIVGALKRTEHEDYYDRNTNFTPFSLRA